MNIIQIAETLRSQANTWQLHEVT